MASESVELEYISKEVPLKEEKMIKSIIVYFSQTGNTKKVSQAICRGIENSIGECAIKTLRASNPKDLTTYDLIGLGYPTWSSKEPPNVRTFINQMDSLEGKHIFLFSTHGARPSGIISSIVPLLIQRGLIIIGFRDWYGSVTLPHMPKAYVTDGHPDGTDIEEAFRFGKEMAELSRKIKSGDDLLIPDFTEEIDLKLHGIPERAPAEFHDARRNAKEERKVNLEKCTGCGICAYNCPVNAIDFSNSVPVFRNDICVPCWFCEQVCPTGAIEVNWAALTAVYDEHNSDELNRTLDIAKKEGRFRRLIPKNDIKWDVHWYQVSKHPRIELLDND